MGVFQRFEDLTQTLEQLVVGEPNAALDHVSDGLAVDPLIDDRRIVAVLDGPAASSQAGVTEVSERLCSRFQPRAIGVGGGLETLENAPLAGRVEALQCRHVRPTRQRPNDLELVEESVHQCASR
jgi:hypothetical protein